MMTLDEAFSRVSSRTSRKQAVAKAALPLFNIDSTPIWREFLADMGLALKRCKCAKVAFNEVAEHNILLLHEVISSTDIFKMALRNAELSNVHDHHWFSQPIVNHEAMHVSLLTTYIGQPIPLHDHPKSNGIVLVLSGKIQIRRYNLAQNLKGRQGNVALEGISDRIFSMGEVDTYTEQSGNIHGIRAMTPKCHFLEVHIPPKDKNSSRSWYLPSGPNMVSSSHLFARRVQGEYFLPL